MKSIISKIRLQETEMLLLHSGFGLRKLYRKLSSFIYCSDRKHFPIAKHNHKKAFKSASSLESYSSPELCYWYCFLVCTTLLIKKKKKNTTLKLLILLHA